MRTAVSSDEDGNTMTLWRNCRASNGTENQTPTDCAWPCSRKNLIWLQTGTRHYGSSSASCPQASPSVQCGKQLPRLPGLFLRRRTNNWVWSQEPSIDSNNRKRPQVLSFYCPASVYSNNVSEGDDVARLQQYTRVRISYLKIHQLQLMSWSPPGDGCIC
jgi:hypothetical protein